LLAQVESEARQFNSTKTIFRQNDVLFGKLRPYLNKVIVANRDGVCTTEIIPIRGYCGLVPEYTRLVLRSSLTMARVDRLMYGVKMPRLGTADATALSYPLPPLAEQHRIVAKVDELMTLCDQLEAAQQERERRRDRLAAASLQRLNQPTIDTTSEAQREHTRFHLHHLPRLTARPEHIKAMRKTILTLAVRGRLVEQNANEESAISLLKSIDRERTTLLKADCPNVLESRTQLRKQAVQVLPEGLSELPIGWTWATLMQCSLLVVDCHNKTAPYSNSGIPLIRTTNVRDGRFNLKEPKFVDEITYARWSARCEPEPGDILITREAPMGEVAIIPPGMKICLGQRMMLVRLAPHTIDPRFLLQSLSDPELMERVQDKPIGATVQHLRVGGVETLLIPLPPLAEQQRIVAKVDDLMALCDQLEAQLTITQTDSSRLLEAVLEAALAPA
jgi:type I restriction enzyme S subunit